MSIVTRKVKHPGFGRGGKAALLRAVFRLGYSGKPLPRKLRADNAAKAAYRKGQSVAPKNGSRKPSDKSIPQ
jgi:hypothetical protein